MRLKKNSPVFCRNSTTLIFGCNAQKDNASSEKSSAEKSTDRPKRGGSPNIENMMAKMDTNGDGKLSKNEAKGPMSGMFSKIDTNGDGYLTKEELQNAPKPKRGQDFPSQHK